MAVHLLYSNERLMQAVKHHFAPSKLRMYKYLDGWRRRKGKGREGKGEGEREGEKDGKEKGVGGGRMRGKEEGDGGGGGMQSFTCRPYMYIPTLNVIMQNRLTASCWRDRTAFKMSRTVAGDTVRDNDGTVIT